MEAGGVKYEPLALVGSGGGWNEVVVGGWYQDCPLALDWGAEGAWMVRARGEEELLALCLGAEGVDGGRWGGRGQMGWTGADGA